MANPTIYVAAPARAPRRGGIKTVAEFITADRLGTGATLEYTSAGCAFPVDDIGLCYGDPAAADKNPDGVSTLAGNGPVFGLYSGVECFADPDNDFDADARRALEQGEDRGIEGRLNAWAATITASATVTGGNLQEAMARAENEADLEYLGAPTLLINRGDLVRIGALNFETEGGVIRTKNGSLVLASGKIAANSVTAVGAITVAQTGIVVNRALDHIHNTELAIAERVYALMVDCGYAARYLVTA